MKKILLLLLIISLGFNAKAQYIPMLQDGSEWYVWHLNEVSYNTNYILEGDTIIASVKYKILFEGSNKILFLREDTLNKTVSVYRGFNNPEEVMYDFNIKQGQSFTFRGSTIVLDSISNKIYFRNAYLKGFTEYLINKSTPKVFYFNGGEIIWIEGIGSILDPFYSTNGGWTVLMCHKSNGFSDYKYVYNANLDDCLGPILHVDNLENINIGVYPNPTTGVFHLNSSSLKRLTVSDISNSQILDYKCIANQTTFDITGLKSGIYLLRIVTTDNKVYNRKIIKQ